MKGIFSQYNKELEVKTINIISITNFKTALIKSDIYLYILFIQDNRKSRRRPQTWIGWGRQFDPYDQLRNVRWAAIQSWSQDHKTSYLVHGALGVLTEVRTDFTSPCLIFTCIPMEYMHDPPERGSSYPYEKGHYPLGTTCPFRQQLIAVERQPWTRSGVPHNKV